MGGGGPVQYDQVRWGRCCSVVHPGSTPVNPPTPSNPPHPPIKAGRTCGIGMSVFPPALRRVGCCGQIIFSHVWGWAGTL